MATLPPFVPVKMIAERLPLIFSAGTPNRQYCIRTVAANTVFTGLYIGAVEGAGRFFGPVHVYRMTGAQAAKSSNAAREAYAKAKGRNIKGSRQYADNTREQIRDETLRDGLVAVGAILARTDLATTSSLPKYALRAEFAALFDPALQGGALDAAIATFQQKFLSKSALARVAIMRSGAAATTAGVMVTFPNGVSRQLAPGPSSVISQAVVEVFAKQFLEIPAVLWLSESGNKVVVSDDALAKKIGLIIQADKNLPDLIMVDLGPSEPLILFVEVVATDGAMTARRQEAMYALTDAAGFDRKQVAFLTAYEDRESPGFKKTVAQLAWGSFAWFVSEPAHIVFLRDGATSGARLASLIG